MVDFDRVFFYDAVRALSPTVPVFEISCRNGIGLAQWADWLLAQRLHAFSTGTRALVH